LKLQYINRYLNAFASLVAILQELWVCCDF